MFFFKSNAVIVTIKFVSSHLANVYFCISNKQIWQHIFCQENASGWVLGVLAYTYTYTYIYILYIYIRIYIWVESTQCFSSNRVHTVFLQQLIQPKSGLMHLKAAAYKLQKKHSFVLGGSMHIYICAFMYVDIINNDITWAHTHTQRMVILPVWTYNLDMPGQLNWMHWTTPWNHPA